MDFNRPEQIESICYQMRQSDWSRSSNRARIDALFNGVPPYDESEVEENNIEVNVNFLESTRLSHDARSQFYQAFLKPGNFFNCTTDSGAPHKRSEYSQIVTKEINKIMKRSLPYIEKHRSTFAMDVLHGIGPSGWKDSQRWRPDAIGVEDVYIPANTLLTMDNLPFFPVRRSLTAPELIKLTQGSHVDPGWNQKLVKSLIKWVDKESATLNGTNWPEAWSPEKIQERIKGDGGFYMGDRVPTIDCYDFYFWNDDPKQSGWNRRMILDSWSTPSGASAVMTRKQGEPYENHRDQFLYNPGKRIFAQHREEIINWQFADLSAVAPFRYHSVRSLGFLMYSVCHLQNRMRCKFNEAVFEQLMVYFRINDADSAQRALKVDLVNRGFVDSSVDFIKAGDRYQVNAALAEMGLRENGNLIAQNASSYTTQQQQGQNQVEKTKFQVMAETNAITSLVSAGLQQAYLYQKPEYREIFRRFTIKDSRDPEVRTVQANCLRQGVPERVLYNRDCWEQEPERVMGAGNKTLEMAISQQLMEMRNLYDPEAQRQILHDVTLAVTDDAARADALVPKSPNRITDSVHDAQLAAGALLQGLPVAVKGGMNHIEYVDTLLATLAMVVQKAMQTRTATMEQIMGMQNMAQNIQQHIDIIGQDPEEKARVKQYGDQLGKVMNLVKALAQQAQEKMEKENAQGGQDPEAKAKIEAMMITANAKAENTKTAHAQRTAQRQIQFELAQQQKRQEFEAKMEMERKQMEQELHLADVKAASDVVIAQKKATVDAKVKEKAAAAKPKPKE